MDFNNKSGLEFTDISSEEYREYHWESGYSIRLDAPTMLHVSESGGHRVFYGDGLSRYIKPTWADLEWKARQGQPHFVK